MKENRGRFYIHGNCDLVLSWERRAKRELSFFHSFTFTLCPLTVSSTVYYYYMQSSSLLS